MPKSDDRKAMADAINANHAISVGGHTVVMRCIHCRKEASGPNNEPHIDLYIPHARNCAVLIARKVAPVKIPARRNSNDYYCGRDS